jgi:hypothetical protein
MKRLTQLREEAIRLRREERLSLKEIEKRIKVSRGSPSNWLRDYPLSPAERLAKRKAKLTKPCNPGQPASSRR